jgi:hypothetical protein
MKSVALKYSFGARFARFPTYFFSPARRSRQEGAAPAEKALWSLTSSYPAAAELVRLKLRNYTSACLKHPRWRGVLTSLAPSVFQRGKNSLLLAAYYLLLRHRRLLLATWKGET